ncbi:hypothetical protein B7P43_G10346 [Cryptotermes secundus]|uniref:Uncharacterized protein n=1 Tax=Cryptotermes secundus TaxID=105785 RepID=A0A2J7PZG1_9NEOP|nr:hypothetical protein B7P43_G10346 [Cryptotermes secundus]
MDKGKEYRKNRRRMTEHSEEETMYWEVKEAERKNKRRITENEKERMYEEKEERKEKGGSGRGTYSRLWKEGG